MAQAIAGRLKVRNDGDVNDRPSMDDGRRRGSWRCGVPAT